MSPIVLSFELDENDGLHAVWFYGARAAGATPDWVRYTHSFDGGHTWSAPFTIDQVVEGSDHQSGECRALLWPFRAILFMLSGLVAVSLIATIAFQQMPASLGVRRYRSLASYRDRHLTV